MIIEPIKQVMPIAIKKWLVRRLRRQAMPLPERACAFLFLAADYGNIGDLAITAAQANFLRTHANGREVVRVPISRTLLLIDSIKRQIRPQDIVTIVGGGNMGSLYPDIEELRQRVIRSFPGNRIVCFPQTLDWNDAPASSRALQRIVRIYARHPDIHVFARESITREKLENLFRAHANVKIGYVPDIVLSATAAALGAVQGAQPDGILLCMRDDAERALDARQRQALEDALAQAGLPMRITDTHAGGSGLDDGRCARLLADKIDEFRVARLVVTDRLHGMILSTLAGTPCLVVPNANHKIRQTWLDWLSDLPQVQFLAPSEFVALPGIVAELLDVERRDPQAPVIDPALYGGLQQALVLR